MAGGLIPENILEDILSRVDIVELISGFLPLKRAGRNFKASCPFHHEKTPSFMVSGDRQIYHCFGCGESGNAFKFLMRFERMEFPEAVQSLAKKAGVTLPEIRKESSSISSLSEQLYKINELAANFYAANLNSASGQQARKYLVNRGINEEAAKLFRLGFACAEWEGLINFLRGKNIALTLMEKAGLILAKEAGGYHDRFRNRIIFPIVDIKSRVIGFGARVLDENLPKYINSPETAVYTKGRNLYGLNLAKDSVREEDFIAVVEGYLDFITPYTKGFKNLVASLGTALTLEQARLLKRYTRNVVVVYDADAAGEMASLRSLDIFLEEEIDVRVVSLPTGFDPDGFVREKGIAAFKEKVKQANGLFDYKLGILKTHHAHKGIEGKAKIACGMLETVSKFKNAVLKSEYVRRLSMELDIREEALLAEIKKVKPDTNAAYFRELPAERPAQINPTEKLLLKLMLEETALIERIRERLEPADFSDARLSKVVSIMFELVEQGKAVEPRILINHLGEEEISRFICESIFLPQEASLQEKEKMADDCIQRLKNEKLKFRRSELHNRIKTAQGLGNEEELSRLMREFNELIKIKV